MVTHPSVPKLFLDAQLGFFTHPIGTRQRGRGSVLAGTQPCLCWGCNSAVGSQPGYRARERAVCGLGTKPEAVIEAQEPQCCRSRAGRGCAAAQRVIGRCRHLPGGFLSSEESQDPRSIVFVSVRTDALGIPEGGVSAWPKCALLTSDGLDQISHKLGAAVCILGQSLHPRPNYCSSVWL